MKAILIALLLVGAGAPLVRHAELHAQPVAQLMPQAALQQISQPLDAPPPFMGFLLGMKASNALAIVGKSADALNGVKYHNGQRILSDTVSVGECKIAMRRSLGFDSSASLLAVGLTYKTTPENVEDARLCVYRWLKSLYGSPNEEPTENSGKQDIWRFGDTKLTLESKGYTDLDFFVLIYYYKNNDKPN